MTIGNGSFERGILSDTYSFDIQTKKYDVDTGKSKVVMQEESLETYGAAKGWLKSIFGGAEKVKIGNTTVWVDSVSKQNFENRMKTAGYEVEWVNYDISSEKEPLELRVTKTPENTATEKADAMGKVRLTQKERAEKISDQEYLTYTEILSRVDDLSTEIKKEHTNIQSDGSVAKKEKEKAKTLATRVLVFEALKNIGKRNRDRFIEALATKMDPKIATEFANNAHLENLYKSGADDDKEVLKKYLTAFYSTGINIGKLERFQVGTDNTKGGNQPFLYEAASGPSGRTEHVSNHTEIIASAAKNLKMGADMIAHLQAVKNNLAEKYSANTEGERNSLFNTHICHSIIKPAIIQELEKLKSEAVSPEENSRISSQQAAIKNLEVAAFQPIYDKINENLTKQSATKSADIKADDANKV